MAAIALFGDLTSKRGAKAFDNAVPLNSTSEIFVASFEMVDCKLGFTNFAKHKLMSSICKFQKFQEFLNLMNPKDPKRNIQKRNPVRI